MTIDTASADASLLGAEVAVPQHVVYRSFPSETVVLNLQTGRYHGLNATAGRMLETLEKAENVQGATAELAEHFQRPMALMQEDVSQLCSLLLERGLVEIRVRGAVVEQDQHA
jgi:hypothetical protein